MVKKLINIKFDHNMKRIINGIILLLSLGFYLTTSAQTQVNNSDFENWEDIGEQSERPAGWNNLTNAGGTMGVLTSSIKSTYQSQDNRPGSTGQYSVKIVTQDIVGISANGTMTTGQMQAPSITPSDGFNITKTNDSLFNQPFTAKPDSLVVWVKYSITDSTDNARISAIIHDDYDYTDPEQSSDDQDHVVGTAIKNFQTGNNWQRLSIPFDYNAGSAINPEYILLTFTSSAIPGGGVSGATLYVDDLEMIYNPEVSIEPSEDQDLIVGESGDKLTAQEEWGGGNSITREWKYREENENEYHSFSPKETGKTYTPQFDQPGKYYIVVESDFGGTTSLTSNEVEINVTSNMGVSDNDYKISTIPVYNYEHGIKIDLRTSEIDQPVLQIYDLAGKIIKTQNLQSKQLNTVEINAEQGVYLYNLISRGGAIKGKFILNNSY